MSFDMHKSYKLTHSTPYSYMGTLVVLAVSVSVLVAEGLKGGVGKIIIINIHIPLSHPFL